MKLPSVLHRDNRDKELKKDAVDKAGVAVKTSAMPTSTMKNPALKKTGLDTNWERFMLQKSMTKGYEVEMVTSGHVYTITPIDIQGFLTKDASNERMHLEAFETTRLQTGTYDAYLERLAKQVALSWESKRSKGVDEAYLKPTHERFALDKLDFCDRKIMDAFDRVIVHFNQKPIVMNEKNLESEKAYNKERIEAFRDQAEDLLLANFKIKENIEKKAYIYPIQLHSDMKSAMENINSYIKSIKDQVE